MRQREKERIFKRFMAGDEPITIAWNSKHSQYDVTQAIRDVINQKMKGKQ